MKFENLEFREERLKLGVLNITHKDYRNHLKSKDHFSKRRLSEPPG
jgi:hypothetical protein